MWLVRLPERGGGLREEEMRFLEDALGIRGIPGEKEGNREQRTRRKVKLTVIPTSLGP